MKIIFYSVIFLASVLTGLAQGETVRTDLSKFPTIPAFTLLKLDSSNLTRMDLPKNKKTMIMYFSPGCDHCRHQTDSMLAHMDRFKDIYIVMATYQPYDDMKAFYRDYKLGNYPNIIIGRDTKYFFPPFYKILNLPYMILFDEKGKLITTFEGTTKIEKLTDAFRTRNT